MTTIIDDLSRQLRDALDDEGHDNECILRCLRNDCDDDHHCYKCGENGD